MMRRKQPAGSAAHRKPAHQNPVVIDRVMLLHAGQRLERIHFPGKPVAVAIAAIRMNDDCIERRKLARALHMLGEEIDLTQSLTPAVIPEIKPAPASRISSNRIGND